MKYLKILGVVSELWPVIRALVEQVEETFPEAGIGKFKLAEVLRILREGWDRADLTFADVERGVTAAISAIVALANLTGRFYTKAPA